MAALATVQDFVTSARRLLKDTVAPYRYADTALVDALNIAVREARRIRPDLFIDRANSLPTYSTVDTTAVDIDEQYRSAFLYYIVGFTSLIDEEEVTDQRATVFLNKFIAQLQTAAA